MTPRPFSLFHALRYQAELFFTALGFFTRMPVPAWVPYSRERLNHAARWFPAVGWVVGGFCATVLWLAALLWPWPLAVLLALALGVWLTGAFHEDGLADAADGLGGGWDKAQVLTIMKDSRLGTFGAVALVLMLAGKFAALHALGVAGFGQALIALLVAHPLSRLCSGTLIRCMDYVREDAEAKAKPLAERMGGGEWVFSAACGLAPLALLPWPRALLVLASASVVTLCWARYLRRRLGGFTGDCLGAAQQLAELAIYLALLLRCSWI